jgi:acyl-CoA thioesterase
MSWEFDTDTAVDRVDDGTYTATLTDRWGVAATGAPPNGGYVLAIVARALVDALPPPDPLTVTAHYLRPAASGPATVEVETVRAGRSFATGEARLVQPTGEVVRALATVGSLPAEPPVPAASARPPQLPPPEACVRGRDEMPDGQIVEIARRFEHRWPPGTPGWANGAPSGTARSATWIRFADGREPDLFGLVTIVDALPPVVFELGMFGWVPTLELTVHLRAHPAPGWLRCLVSNRFVQHGLLEEDVEIWDSNDVLVAQSRQLALQPRRAASIR